MNWNVHLSGEIHTYWHQQIIDGANENDLPITFTSAVTNHEVSDAAGDVLGAETSSFWRDHNSSKVNSNYTKTYMNKCDLAVVCFREKYKQWNAAFDAGYCSAIGKPCIARRKHYLPAQGSRCFREGLGQNSGASCGYTEVCH